MSRHRLPRRQEGHFFVVITKRLTAVSRLFSRKPAPPKSGTDRVEVRCTCVDATIGSVDQNLVPVDAHARHDTRLTTSTQKLTGEIHGHRLRATDRNPDVFNYRSPTTLRILYLQRRQFHLFV